MQCKFSQEKKIPDLRTSPQLEQISQKVAIDAIYNNTAVYELQHSITPIANASISRNNNLLAIIVRDLLDAVLRNHLDQHALEINR